MKTELEIDTYFFNEAKRQFNYALKNLRDCKLYVLRSQNYAKESQRNADDAKYWAGFALDMCITI
jgi:hypothetical protein